MRADAGHQRRTGFAVGQPGREIVGRSGRAPPGFMHVIEQRPQRHPLDGLGQGGGRGYPLARVVGHYPRCHQVQLESRAAPRNAFQPPQAVFDRLHQRRAEGRRRRLLVGVHQAEFLAQHRIAQRLPAPAGQIVGKLVKLEVVLQGAAHHVMLEHGVRRRADGVEQFAEIRATPPHGAAHQPAVDQGKRLGGAHLPTSIDSCDRHAPCDAVSSGEA